MTAFLLIFVVFGIFAGYASTRLHTFFQIEKPSWRANALYTSMFFPTVMFSIFFVLNVLIWGEKSSGAVSFSTLVAILVMWFGISVCKIQP